MLCFHLPCILLSFIKIGNVFRQLCGKRIILKSRNEDTRDTYVVDGVITSAEAMSYFQILSQG